jgi:hypothetical protein
MRKAAREKYGDRLVDTKYHGDAMSEAGVSDILCCLDGIFVACEVKAPESYKVRGEGSVHKALAKGPTVKQRLFVNRVLAAGGVAGFAADIEGFMVMLACAAAQAKGQGPCEGHNLDVAWPVDPRF